MIFRYVSGFLDSPMLRPMVSRRLKESVELSNRVTLEVHSSSFRTTRGYSIAAALCDEVAFWRQEDSAEPDKEVINALRPGLASVPGSLLLCLSSPYSRRGELWRTHQRHFGKDSGVLVWQAATAMMNPSIDRAVIERAMEEDPAAASAEWLAEFRVDVEDFIALEAVKAAIERKVIERPPESGISYRAFCDPSGGSGRDSMTLAVSHEADDVRILDAVRERRPPFSPESVVGEFCELLKSYKVRTVEGDRYAGEWPREQFRKQGVGYEPAAMPKSDLYLNLLPAINSGRVKLLDIAKLKNQLVGLERRTSRSGKDSIDHPPGAHDDIANAVAGALVAARPVHHQISV